MPLPARDLREDSGSPAAAARNAELAAELLDVVNETELEHVVRKLVSETAQRAGGSLPRGATHLLSDVLTRIARRTLPTLGSASGPHASSERSPAETAVRVFGLELEGMSAEDRDFEIARQLVRLGEAAVLRSLATPDAASPVATVAAGVTRAGRELAPGLLDPVADLSLEPGTGPWTRSRNDVPLNGVEPPWR
jgi:hypothetical protein